MGYPRKYPVTGLVSSSCRGGQHVRCKGTRKAAHGQRPPCECGCHRKTQRAGA